MSKSIHKARSIQHLPTATKLQEQRPRVLWCLFCWDIRAKQAMDRVVAPQFVGIFTSDPGSQVKWLHLWQLPWSFTHRSSNVCEPETSKKKRQSKHWNTTVDYRNCQDRFGGWSTSWHPRVVNVKGWVWVERSEAGFWSSCFSILANPMLQAPSSSWSHNLKTTLWLLRSFLEDFGGLGWLACFPIIGFRLCW